MTSKWKKRLAAGLAGTAIAIALPSSVLALNLLDRSSDTLSAGGSMNFTPASIDPNLARILVERSSSNGQLMRFTPAGSSADPAERSVTVAVRVGQDAVQNLAIRNAIESASNSGLSASGSNLRANVRIAPTSYNLGLARGYQSFTTAPKNTAASTANLSTTLSDAAIPDLSDFEPTAGVREKPSRFAARIELEETEKKGAAPLTINGTSDQSLDVAGSYRLTRNLDVTAGVRISQERDARSALPDIEEQETQAVYIGTQFRF